MGIEMLDVEELQKRIKELEDENDGLRKRYDDVFTRAIEAEREVDELKSGILRAVREFGHAN